MDVKQHFKQPFQRVYHLTWSGSLLFPRPFKKELSFRHKKNVHTLRRDVILIHQSQGNQIFTFSVKTSNKINGYTAKRGNKNGYKNVDRIAENYSKSESKQMVCSQILNNCHVEQCKNYKNRWQNVFLVFYDCQWYWSGKLIWNVALACNIIYMLPFRQLQFAPNSILLKTSSTQTNTEGADLSCLKRLQTSALTSKLPQPSHSLHITLQIRSQYSTV